MSLFHIYTAVKNRSGPLSVMRKQKRPNLYDQALNGLSSSCLRTAESQPLFWVYLWKQLFFLLSLYLNCLSLLWYSATPRMFISHSLRLYLLASISDCQWECWKSMEPMGAAVCVRERWIDSEAEWVLHNIIFIQYSRQAATRTGWRMDRFLCRGNLQPAVTAACQYHRYVWIWCFFSNFAKYQIAHILCVTE